MNVMILLERIENEKDLLKRSNTLVTHDFPGNTPESKQPSHKRAGDSNQCDNVDLESPMPGETNNDKASEAGSTKM